MEIGSSIAVVLNLIILLRWGTDRRAQNLVAHVVGQNAQLAIAGQYETKVMTSPPSPDKLSLAAEWI